MAWERARDGWRREGEETAEQTAAELAVGLRGRVQRGQQVGFSGSSDEQQVDHTVGSLLAAQTPERAEVVAVAMREWERQHEWLHSPEERAAVRREAEQELARVVAALRVWHEAAAAATAVTTAAATAAAGYLLGCHHLDFCI